MRRWYHDDTLFRRHRGPAVESRSRRMWIVKLALRRPYTFIVMALLLVILGPLTILRTAKDIFPNIGIPVVSVIWTYSGLPPEEMSGRITGSFERVSLVAVNNIDHIESQSVTGISVIKYFF